MFFNVLSHFKDDRKKIIIIIVVVALIIFFIKALNEYVKQQRINSSSNNYTTAFSQSSSSTNALVIKNTSTDNGISNSSINNNEIQFEETSIDNVEKLISVFLFYCNNNQIEDAYNLLTDDCKELLYPTKVDFYDNYYVKYFKDIKDYNYSRYGGEASNVYKITYESDPLTTGKSLNDKNVDYVTAVQDEDGSYKINISGFVKKEKLDIQESNSYLKANLVEKVTYVDYEIYKIKIENTTLVNMTLGDMSSNSTIYLQDEDNNKFYIDNNEYINEDLTINYRSENTIELKFDRKLKTENSKITKIVFSKVLLKNRAYYDNTVVEENTNGNVTYSEKYTTYNSDFYFEMEI